jgi:hypothetical protein
LLAVIEEEARRLNDLTRQAVDMAEPNPKELKVDLPPTPFEG